MHVKVLRPSAAASGDASGKFRSIHLDMQGTLPVAEAAATRNGAKVVNLSHTKTMDNKIEFESEVMRFLAGQVAKTEETEEEGE